MYKPYSIFYHYDAVLRSRCSYPRAIDGESIRFNLTRWTNMVARVCPVGPHAPTLPLPASNYRTAPPTYSQPSSTRDHQK